MQELMKHPCHSSKICILIFVEKPGTGVFLMKEKAKLYKVPKDRVSHMLSKRLSSEEQKNDIGMMEANVADKRKNLGGGQFKSVPVPSQQMNSSGQK